MTFPWLPDPERYKHPRLSWLLQYVFGIVLSRMIRVDHDLPPGFEPPPGTLVVSNHLRDSDAPIVGMLLCRRDGVRIRGALPFFATREDLFQPGAMANLLYTCPRPFIHLLRLIPLRWFFRNVRAIPMRRLREFTWQDTLHELERIGLGACDPVEVFNARGQRELRDCLGDLPARVDAINPWHMGTMRVGRWGLRRLTMSTLRRLDPEFRAVVTQHLRDAADRLDEGNTVYFAPEGCVSLNGRFGRIRAGTWQLGRMTAHPLPFLPLAISYDPLGPGRTRVVVRKGDMMPNLDVNDPSTLVHAVRSPLIAHRVITPSHLLAQFLCVHAEPFATHELVAWLDDAKAATRDAGLALDPLFSRMTTEALVDERLRWLQRKRLISGGNGTWQNHWKADTAPTWMRPAGVVRYLVNALSDFSPELARTLSP